MAVDDLWYLSKPGPNDERLPSKRHGRGKRWRVRNEGARTVSFDKKADAEQYNSNVRADLSRGQYIDPKEGLVTVADYAEQWRHQQLHVGSTTERVEQAVRLHIAGTFLGPMAISKVRQSHIKTWVKDRHPEYLGANTLSMVFSGVLSPMFTAAVADRVIGFSPCTGVRLPDVPDAEYYIAKPEQVHALYETLPAQYRAAVYVAAGCGWRAGEVMGLELSGVDFLRREVHVRQALTVLSRVPPFLGPPKTAKSKRTTELPDVVGEALARHVELFPPASLEIEDRTDRRQIRTRKAQLLFTREGRPIRRARWSEIWQPAVAKVGLPEGYGMRDLRHYFATVLIYGGANVKRVQLAMGHSTPMQTLNTYTGYWPDAVDQTRSLVDAALGSMRSAIGRESS